MKEIKNPLPDRQKLHGKSRWYSYKNYNKELFPFSVHNIRQ